MIANPQVLGPDVKIVAFKYGRWSGNGGAIERDRMDVLGLDRDGHLVVVLLKGNKAPDTGLSDANIRPDVCIAAFATACGSVTIRSAAG